MRGPASGIPIAEAIGTGQEVTRHQEVDIRGNNRELHVSFKFGQNQPVEFNIQICSKCLRYKPKFLSALSFMVILLSKTGHKATGRFPCASRTAAPRGVGIAAWPKRTESVPPRDRAAGANPGARRQLSEASRSAARQNVESHLGIPSAYNKRVRASGTFSFVLRWLRHRLLASTETREPIDQRIIAN